MSSAWVARRFVRSGPRYTVHYRLGGRESKQAYAGTFRDLAEAEAWRDEVLGRLARMEHPAKPRRPRSRDRRPVLVYLAEFGGLVKIGVSIDPVRRCRDLHAELLVVEEGGVERERELHRRFGASRVRGEWFRPTVALRAYVRAVRKRQGGEA